MLFENFYRIFFIYIYIIVQLRNIFVVSNIFSAYILNKHHKHQIRRINFSTPMAMLLTTVLVAALHYVLDIKQWYDDIIFNSKKTEPSILILSRG